MGTVALIFVLASLGLPGLGNFIAEFLTLIGTWDASPVLTIFAAIGIVIATAYSLRIMQKVFLGNDQQTNPHLSDLSSREKLMLIPMVVLIIWLGLFPQTVLHTSKNVITEILNSQRKTISEVDHIEDNISNHHE
jgi:NADH-quinone oxidoreductase subunit M